MLAWLLHNALLAAVLAVGVAVLCRWKRVGPSLRHALWVLVLVRLILPPGIVTWPWQVAWPRTPESVAPNDVVAMPVPMSPPGFETLDAIDVRLLVASSPSSEDESPAAAAMAEAPASPAWGTLVWWSLASVWLGGALIVASRHLHGVVMLARLVRRARPAPPGVLRHVAETAAKLGVRPPRTRVVAGLGSPLIAGLLRPVLLWPEELKDRLNDEGIRAVLVHELAHLRRRDHWVRWLEMAAACVWWWNPLFRIARRRVRQYAELACDAWVMNIMPRARRAYAEALLKVCESVAATPEPAAALGVSGDPTDFQRRLTMIMRESVACRLPRKTLFVLCVLTLLTVPGWSFDDPTAPAAEEAIAGNEMEFARFDGLLDLELEQYVDHPDRDRKLADLEAQIQALLKEIQALKREKSEAMPAPADSARSLLSLARSQEEKARKLAQAAQDQARAAQDQSRRKLGETPAKAAAPARAAISSPRGDGVLYRVTYPIDAARGEALAKFLKQTVKVRTMEVTVDGSKITITATPEHQNVIARLIQLIGEMPSKNSR